jgi:hypothetical protein
LFSTVFYTSGFTTRRKRSGVEGEDGLMGEIIPFRAGQRRRAPVEPPPGPAQILFFLGVRYSRDDDDLDGRPSRRGSVAPSRQK